MKIKLKAYRNFVVLHLSGIFLTYSLLSCVQPWSLYSGCLYLWSGQVVCSQLPVGSLCLSLRSFFRPHSCIGNIATVPQTPWLHRKQALNNQKSSVQSSRVYVGNGFSLLPFQHVQVRQRQISADHEGKGFIIKLTIRMGSQSVLLNTDWLRLRGTLAGTSAVGWITNALKPLWLYWGS